MPSANESPPLEIFNEPLINSSSIEGILLENSEFDLTFENLDQDAEMDQDERRTEDETTKHDQKYSNTPHSSPTNPTMSANIDLLKTSP